MEKGKVKLTQKDAENTPAGGVVVGKRDGQTMIYDDASLGGYFVGKLHKDGGIKMVNKSTGQPLEVQGSEIIITAPAVADTTKREFEGKMMTNREILSKINSDGGGVSFADGGDIPAKIHTTDCEYKFGGKVVKDTDIAHSLGMNSTLKKGKQHFSSGDTTYDVDGIYNAIKKGKLRLKTKEVKTFPMKYPVYDKKYSETVKTDFRKPNGITVRTESGEEVLIDGNHRMNNAYLKGKKTMKTYYIEDPKQISKFSKKNKFELGGENKKADVSDWERESSTVNGDYGIKAKIVSSKNFDNIYGNYAVYFFKNYDNKGGKQEILENRHGFKTYDEALDYAKQNVNKFKDGGHLSKGKSLKQIAEMHNVSLAHINEELAKGLEVEKEHFTDFKERTRVAKDHLVENPNYYTILAKAGLKNGGIFNNGGSVSKENEFAFNKKSDRLKSFYKTNNPSIDSLLIECQPFINDLIEQQKKLVLKLTFNTNGVEEPMSEFAIEQYEIALIFKMVQSFNKYLKTTDILTDVTIKNVGLFEISATVIRDGKKYSFITELIPAGGYNVQEFHYRYITKTDLPESKENSAIDNLKSKLSVFKKIKSLEDDINRNIKSISDLEKYIKQGYYGDDDDDKLYRVDLNKEAILYEQENIERYKKEIEKLKIKQNDLESVLISLDKFKNGGHILSHHRHSENLVKDAKSGNTPARDLNNYNDIMDLGADEAVGGDSGLAFADGGEIKDIEPYFERFNRIGLSGVDNVMKSQVNFMDFERYLDSAQRGIENKYVGYEKFPFHEFVKKYDYVTKKDYYYSNQEHKAEIDLLVEKLKKEGYTVLAKTYSFTKGASQGFNKNNKAINVFAFKLKSYANGGVVYDTTKPKIEKVTIKSTMYGRASIVGRNASNVSELKDIIIDYVRNSTDDEDMIIFYVNDNTRGSYSINLNKGKKNTVKNVNTETVNAENIKRVIDAYTYLVKNYDWTDFFSGTQKSTVINKKENSPDLVRLEYSLKGNQFYVPFRTGVDLLKEFFKIEKYCIENPNESVDVKIIAEVTDSTGGITATERNITFGEKHFKPRNWTNIAIENLMTKDWFSDKLDFTDFFKSSSKNSTSTKTLLTKDELINSKIWIGDDLKLLEQVKEKLESLGFYKDKVESGDKNISVFIFINDFYIMALREKSDLFNDSSLKEIFPSDLGINVSKSQSTTLTKTPLTKQGLFDSKIWIGDDVVLRDKVVAKIFEMGIPYDTGYGSRDYSKNIYILIYGKDFVVWSDKKFVFDNDTRKEIFPEDLGIDVNNLGASASQTPTASTSTKTPLTKQDLLMGKIWIGDDVNLKKKVIEKLEEIGIPFDKKNGNPDAEESIGISIYDFDFVVFKESKEQFDADKRRKEFFPEDLGIDVNNLGASATKPIVYKIMFVTKQKNNPYPPNIETAKSFDEFFTILKGLVEIKDTLDDNVILRIINEDKMKEYNLSLTLEKDMFNLLTDIEAKENLMEGLSANNQELDFKQFFSSSAQPSLTDLKSTKIFVNGDKDLIEKVIKKAEQLGWNNNEGLKKQGSVSAIYFSGGSYVGWLSEEEFKQNISFKEIFPSDLGIDYNTSNVVNSVRLNFEKQDGTPYDKITATSGKELFKELEYAENNWLSADDDFFRVWFIAYYKDKDGKDLSLSESFNFGDKFFVPSNSDYDSFEKLVYKDWFDDKLDFSKFFNSASQSSFNISNLSNERIKLLFDLKQIVDKENLQVLPANIESASSKQDDEEFIDLLDEEQLVVTFKKGKVNLNPTDERTSKILFEFFEFQKDFDSFSRKKAQELLSSYIADESKLYTTEFEKFEGDLSKAKKDLEDLKKLLPAFQQIKFAPQRALIINEIKKLNNKITKDGFIFTNELMSSANQLFTAQGLLKYYFDQTTQSPVQPLEPPCNLPTPNGMESKLPISAYFNVRTKQFKSWFGDWEKAYETNNYFDCSKMIDEETKEPKIYYHGVRKYIPNFGQFSNMGQGVVRPYGSFEPPTSFPASYFADNEEYAKFYGGVAKNMPKPSPDYEPFIYKVFLSVKNPLNLLPLGFEASYKDLLDYLFVAYGIKKTASANVLNRINNDMVSKHPVWVYVRNDISLLETIKEYGYDALIQIGDIPTFDEDGNPIDDRSKSMKEEEFLTFYPTQVKSATVLKSFYLDFFKDIRFNKGGYVRI